MNGWTWLGQLGRVRVVCRNGVGCIYDVHVFYCMYVLIYDCLIYINIYISRRAVKMHTLICVFCLCGKGVLPT